MVVRERVREGKAAIGRRLLEVPGYTYRIFVTNRSESAEVIWRAYKGRACIEQRIEELKNDLSASGFCVREFYGTESAFLAVVFAFNLLGPYQRQITPEKPYRQPATVRTQDFVAGAILGLVGEQITLKLSKAWGGLSKHKPLLDVVLQWQPPTPPKSNTPFARLAPPRLHPLDLASPVFPKKQGQLRRSGLSYGNEIGCWDRHKDGARRGNRRSRIGVENQAREASGAPRRANSPCQLGRVDAGSGSATERDGHRVRV